MRKLNLLIFIFLTVTSAYAASWKAFRQGTDRSGAIYEQAYPYTTFTSSLPGWVSAEAQDKIMSSAVVKDGAVYFGSRDNSIWCLDAYTGAILWQYNTDGWVDSTPCLWGGFVYVISRDGRVYCFKAKYGAGEEAFPVWTYDSGSNNCSSPVVSEGKIYFISGPPLAGAPEGSLYVLDAYTGGLVVKQKLSQFGYSSPAVSAGRAYFAASDGSINCFDGNSVLWSYKVLDSFYLSAPVVSAGTVYFYAGGWDHKLYAINTAQPDRAAWTSPELAVVATDGASPAVSGNRAVVHVFPYNTGWYDAAFVSYSSGVIYCVDLTSGAVMWKKDYATRALPKDSPGFTSSPAIANDVVYVGNINGELFALNLADGSQIAKYRLDGAIVASPAVSNGWVYTGTLAGKFYGIRAEKTVSINYPDNGDVIISTVEVKATVLNPALTYYILELGKEISPSSFTYQAVVTGSSEAANAAIAKIALSAFSDGGYAFRLTASGGGLSASAINTFNVDNPPVAPLNVTAGDTEFDGGGSLTLKWNKSADDGSGDNDVKGYKIYKSTFNGGFSFLVSVAAGVVKYTDDACSLGTTYYFKLNAFDNLSDSADSVSASASSLADGVLINAGSGGTVTLALPDGTTTEIEVPKGSVGSNVYMGIKVPDTSENHSTDGVPLTVNPTGVIREFGVTPADTKFISPVIIKLPYRDSDVVNVRSENLINLRVFWWNVQKSEWNMVNTSEIHLDEKRVWARVDHFSLFRIMEYVPGRLPLLAKESTYVYPNPARGDKIYFKFLLGNAADVTVDVYNVAGELIWHTVQSFTQADAGLAKTIEWDISGKASGTYVYRVSAKSSADEKTVTKKLAIIH